MFSSDQRVVVFDFDGVICDSTNECLVTSWNAWQLYNGKSPSRKVLLDFSDEEILKFKQLRPRVRGAGEYLVLHYLIEKDIEISSNSEYEKYILMFKDNFSSYKKIFFECRNDLRSSDINKWLDLHTVFEDVINIIKDLNLNSYLYIATLKDGESVRLILKKYGIVVPSVNFYDQSDIKTKLEALELIRASSKNSHADIIFIDDNVTHLIEPYNQGYKVYHAAWSGVLTEFLTLANNYGITSVKNVKEIDL